MIFLLMSFFVRDDVKIYYEQKNIIDHDTIVFIHAGIADSRMWDNQFDFFSRKYGVIRYDMRGFGKSSYSQNEFIHANDLKELLDELKVLKVHLVACSFGCQVAFDFALEYPIRVRSMTLVNGKPFGFKNVSNDPNPLRKEANEAFNNKDFKKSAEIESKIWFIGRKRDIEDVSPQLFQKVVDMDEIALENESIIQPNEKKLHPDIMEKLSMIQVPMSYIIGLLDEPNEVLACQDVAKQLKAEVFTIDASAHLPNMEKPHEFNGILSKFLEKI